MKRIAFIGMFLLLVAAVSTMAQTEPDSVFHFDDMIESVDLKSVDMTLVSGNYFGDDIALKYYVLQQTYTFVIKGTPSSPGDKTEIEKPVIYYSIKKMNRYYKKMVKKGLINREDARLALHHVLNVGLSIKNQGTEDFENALRATSSAEEVAKLFSQVILD